MNYITKDKIAEVFRSCVDRTIKRVSYDNQTYRPFHQALLTNEVVFWSAFERSFSTSFGKCIENVAYIIALSNGASLAERQKETFISIDQAYEIAINNEMNLLRSNDHSLSHDWNDTLERIRRTQASGKMKKIRVISDLWWKKDGTENFLSIKTVKPNIDQTEKAKKDCLLLSIANPKCRVFFGLPYNPYGERKNDYAHTEPMKIFNFHTDPVVLIGKEMWDTIGGPGCYENLLSIASEVGAKTKEKIVAIK